MSEGTEWGVHCVALLAALPDGQALPAGRLAEFHGIPGPYLAKHLQALSRAGLLETAPGRGGGYRLSRSPSAISVLEVVDAIEGQAPAFRCTEIRQRGPAAATREECRLPCAVHRVMAAAEQAWRDSLRSVTIADLVGMVVRDAGPSTLVSAARWIEEATGGRARR